MLVLTSSVKKAHEIGIEKGYGRLHSSGWNIKISHSLNVQLEGGCVAAFAGLVLFAKV